MVSSVFNFDESKTDSQEPLEKRSKVKSSKVYSYRPILDVTTRIGCLVSNMTLDAIEKTGEFPNIKNIVCRVRALNFDELKDGPIDLLGATSCKLYFLASQKIVIIKAPSKVVAEKGNIRIKRPMEEIEGTQRKLRPLIGVSQNGTLLNLLQLSTNTTSTGAMPTSEIQRSLNFEDHIYSKFPKDHDTVPLPITLCLFREKENGSPSQLRKLKLIQRREDMDLFQLLHQKIPLNFMDALKIARDLLLALIMCHERMGIVVADIKSENVLINLDNKSGRLTDFGLSYFANEANAPTAFRGTLEMMPKEVFMDYLNFRRDPTKKETFPPEKSFARDLWSIGIVLSQLLFRTKPKCCYNLNIHYDHQLFTTFHRTLLLGSPDELLSNQFFNRFSLPPFSASQISIITSVDDQYNGNRIKAMDLISSMVAPDHTKRPTAQNLWRQVEGLIAE